MGEQLPCCTQMCRQADSECPNDKENLADITQGFSSFTISNEALDQIKINSNGSQNPYVAQQRILQTSEEIWLKKEKCVEDLHSEKWGLSLENFNNLEQNVLKNFNTKYIPSGLESVALCYAEHCNDPLECNEILKKFNESLQESQQKISLKQAGKN